MSFRPGVTVEGWYHARVETVGWCATSPSMRSLVTTLDGPQLETMLTQSDEEKFQDRPLGRATFYEFYFQGLLTIPFRSFRTQVPRRFPCRSVVLGDRQLLTRRSYDLEQNLSCRDRHVLGGLIIRLA